MKSFIQFLEPLNKWLWSFLCKRHLILFCGGGPDTPDPIDPGKAMGEYLFGKRFRKDYEGITDPRLQERLIAAESAYRPRYTALELQDIATMAYGIEAGTPNQERLRLEAELAGLKAGAEVDATIDYTALGESLREQYTSAAGPKPHHQPRRGGSAAASRWSDDRKEYVSSGIESAKLAAQLSDKERAAKIAQLEAQIEQMPETLEGQKGLFQMLEDQSRMAGDLQREQLGLQREADVAALREYAPQVVEAYREADPRSAALADLAQQQAETLYAEAEGPLSPERRRIAEQAARQASLARGRIGDESSIAAEILGREQFRSGLRAEARQAGAGAFGQQRQMAGDLGMAILGRPSAAIGLGSQMLGQAQAGAAGPMGPQLFDPNVGINMAMQQQANQASLAGAQAQAGAAKSAGMMQMGGAIGGAAIAAI